MNKIWHEDSLTVYKDAGENRTSISVLVLANFCVKNGQNRKNDLQNLFWMIQKILYWKIFLKMVQNGPIRKVITIKVIFEDLLIFFTSCRASWLDT